MPTARAAAAWRSTLAADAGVVRSPASATTNSAAAAAAASAGKPMDVKPAAADSRERAALDATG